MKSSVIVGIGCLIVGFAAGWVARRPPAGTADGAPVAQAAAAKPDREASLAATADRLATKSDRPLELAASTDSPARAVASEDGKPGDDGEPPQELGNAAQDQWAKAMLDRQRKKFDLRIAKLVADLGLNSAQEAKLRSFFDGKLDEIAGKMKASNQGDVAVAKELAGLMRGDGLDDELAAVLGPGQQETYTAMKTKERASKIDSKALKDLAKVNEVVGLSEDQKQAVYQVLYEDAEKVVDDNKDANTFMSVFTEGMGIEIDSDSLGISEAIQAQMETATPGERPADPNAWMKSVRETMNQRINDKVERLRPVLNESQLEQYRSHLETKSTGLFGGAMMGGEPEPEGGGK